MFSLQSLGLVLLGGGFGAVSRYIATTFIGARFGTVFPFGTLFVNVLGSFVMGFIMMFAISEHLTLPEPVRLLLVVGFLGGFTTFSSFSMETMTLFSGSDFFYAFGNMAANLGLGFLAVWLGMAAARALV